MALFKILRGPSSGLKDLPINDGWCYYTPDTGLFYIDYNGTRIPLNAKDAQTLSGASLAQTLNSEGLDKEILSAAAVDEIKNNLELLIAEKQEHITGTEGQVVVIGANGRPTAVDIVANNIEYDNSVSGLLSTSVQNAIDELATISVQPDWNQNDNTQPDYIKNRPFYTGDPVETVLVEESTATFEADSNGLYIADFPSTFVATVGETYEVSWDGTVYECTCVASGPGCVLGNLSIVGAGSDTGEPFVMAIMNGEAIQIGTADASASHTFSISRTVVPVVKIDKKYLVQPDWNQNDSTAADYVKNRTHYEESSYADYVLNESGTDIVGLSIPEVGGTVTVKINGVESVETVKAARSGTFGDYTYIGNVDYDALRRGGTGWLVAAISGGFTVGFAKPDTTISVGTTVIHKIDEKYLPDTLLLFKPAGKSYLTFSSLSSFTLKVNDSTKHWNGTLEYFAPDKTWTVWDGTTTLSAVSDDGEYVLYLRGAGNTVITGNNPNHRWILTGSNVKCIGNIETLLDYATVESGEHPTMATDCYSYMFSDCTSLTQAPALPATILAIRCYNSMFYGCTTLTQAPALSATTLADNCYDSMFQNCTSLTQAPALPATTLANYCYFHMFYNCTGLTQAFALSATTMADYCYSYMFCGCTSLAQAPALPATTLATDCYSYMFCDCTSLTQAPALPATMLANSCYCSMFYGCTALTQALALPATTLADNCYDSMFCGCTSLKLSSTKTGEYTQEYRIPSSGDGVTATNALSDMFASTGGTFTGTPSINTIYYLSSDNMIVRETEVATLNGYVGSMIDAADSGEVYVQDTEPADAQDGAIWIDTSVNPEIYVGLPEVTAADNGKVLMVLGGQWQVTEMPEIEFDIDNEGNLFIS